MKKIFFKRIAAFLIDALILFVISAMLIEIIPDVKDVSKEQQEYSEYMQKFINQEITNKEFTEKTSKVSYTIAQGTYLSTIAGIILYGVYFIVYQATNNGQTFGKKFLKIRVLKDDGDEADMKSLTLRALINYGIAVNILVLMLLLFNNRGVYVSLSSALNYLQILIIALSLGMMLFGSGKGVHDYLGKTKVEEVI